MGQNCVKDDVGLTGVCLIVRLRKVSGESYSEKENSWKNHLFTDASAITFFKCPEDSGWKWHRCASLISSGSVWSRMKTTSGEDTNRRWTDSLLISSGELWTIWLWMVSVENDTEHTDPLKLKWYESNREKSWQTPKVPEVFDRDWNHPDVSPQMTTEVSAGGHWVNSYEWNLPEYFRETLWGVWWESLWPLTRMWQLDGSFT